MKNRLELVMVNTTSTKVTVTKYLQNSLLDILLDSKRYYMEHLSLSSLPPKLKNKRANQINNK